MRCEACQGTGRTAKDKNGNKPLYGNNFICTECNGSGIAQADCCDGLQCQPDVPTQKKKDMKSIVKGMGDGS